MADPARLPTLHVSTHDFGACQPGGPSSAVLESSPVPGSVASQADLVDPNSAPRSTLSHSPDLQQTTTQHTAVPRASADTDTSDEPYLIAPAPNLGPLPASVILPDSAHTFLLPRSNPVNRQGWRYVPCRPSPSSGPLGPLGQPFQRLVESAPQEVRFSWEDRSQYIYLTEDARTITTDKGFRTARTNIGVREGGWYWEVKVERGGGEGGRHARVEVGQDKGEGEGSWVRLGVGRREAGLNAPVGYDGYSYAYRDRHGDAVTLSRPTPYGTPASSSSTIGVYVSLPPRPPPSATDARDPARIVRKRIPISFKGQLYFESVEFPPTAEMRALTVDPATRAKQDAEEAAQLEKAKKAAAAPGSRPAPAPAEKEPARELPVLEGSKVAFFVDGVCQGVAFEDVYDFLPLGPLPGERKKDPRRNFHDDGDLAYFPMVSVFGGAIATINSGPDFEFPPPDDIEAALWESARPPKGERPVKAEGEEGRRQWRPLSDRYAEYLAEQDHLDTVDEAEALRQEQLRLAALARAPPRPPPSAAHLAPNKRSKLFHSIKPTPTSSTISSAAPSAATSRASSVELGLPPLPGLPGLPGLPVQPAVEARTESALNSPAPAAKGTGAGEMEVEEELVGPGVKVEGGAKAEDEASVGVPESEAGGMATDVAGELDYFIDNLPPVMPTEGGMDFS